MSSLLVLEEGGWIDRKYDYQMWHHIARNYEVEFDQSCLVKEFRQEMVEDRYVVLLDEEGDELLETFEHPQSCVYVIGRSNKNNMMALVNYHESVRIETAITGVCLFNVCAGSILLADRYRKLNGRQC